MATVKQFENLEIWQLARKLVKKVYNVSQKQEFSKDFGLKDEIRRSSVSVMNNISEGFESRTVKRFIDYLGHSKASCGKTCSVLYVALDCNYITQEEFNELHNLAKIISAKTQSFIRYLEGYDSNNRNQEVMVEYQTS
ncbi:MAG: four helix bundle protein [Balneolaceae bacterium]|nr:four helix bundle protein [Balneolaceae bacterium]